MRKIVLGLITALFLTGCTSYGDYIKSVDASNARQVEAQKAQAEAEIAKYTALRYIAESGNETAKIAATMAIALTTSQRSVAMAVAAQPQNEALQWASILSPVAMHGMSLSYNTKLAIRQSDNATIMGINTNQTYRGFASEINDPTIVMQPAPIPQPAPVIVTQPPYNDPIIVRPEIVQPTIVQTQQ